MEYNPQGYYRLSLDEVSMAVWIYKQQKTIAIDNLETDPQVSKRMRDKFNLKSALGSPLVYKGESIGVLMTASEDVHYFTQREIAMIEKLSREASLAINIPRLNEQRMQAERVRAEREERISLLLESTAEAIFGVDLNSICTFENPSLTNMLGYQSEDDLIGEKIHNLIHHTRKDGTPYPWDECRIHIATLAGETAHRDDEVYWRADGSSIPVEY